MLFRSRVASGKTLDVYTRDAVFGPLKMVDSGFLPPAAKLSRIAPTEIMDGKLIHGVVHDPTSRRMGGVAGHAGLFTTAADLARARLQLAGVEDGARALADELASLERLHEALTQAREPEADDAAAIADLEKRLKDARESLDKARKERAEKPPAYAVEIGRAHV